jgi:hypothetical protein
VLTLFTVVLPLLDIFAVYGAAVAGRRRDGAGLDRRHAAAGPEGGDRVAAGPGEPAAAWALPLQRVVYRQLM